MIDWGRELISFARHRASRAQPRSSDETVGRRPEIYRCALRGAVWSGPPLDWVWCTPLCFWQRLFLLCSVSLQILIRRVQTRPPGGWWRGRRGVGTQLKVSLLFLQNWGRPGWVWRTVAGVGDVRDQQLLCRMAVWIQTELSDNKIKESERSCIADNWKHSFVHFFSIT